MISGIILASGFSKRFHEDDKLLYKLNGKSILEYVLSSAVKSNLDEVILVYRTEEVYRIGERYGVKTVINLEADKGMSKSLHYGISMCKKSTDGYMFLVGDQPFITSEVINKLIEAFENKKTIIVPLYNKHRGNPCVFPVLYKEELLSVVGDKGGRDIIKKNIKKVNFIDIEKRIGMDIDENKDLKEIIKCLN